MHWHRSGLLLAFVSVAFAAPAMSQTTNKKKLDLSQLS